MNKPIQEDLSCANSYFGEPTKDKSGCCLSRSFLMGLLSILPQSCRGMNGIEPSLSRAPPSEGRPQNFSRIVSLIAMMTPTLNRTACNERVLMSRSSSPEMFGKRFKERARSDPWISDRIRRYFSRRFTVGTNAPSGQQTVSSNLDKTLDKTLDKP
ncbi:uncharacterized protein CDAR_71341 [Caerostris darwini]|uniref:Uncharacterized protein n=1 Tax=Caerostris darwini TaxID=1538125 RepID=A0AAV4WFI8_9ARAC|nr:uncharacterized protein CDAR_71341 [Caerostris darwini]